MSDSITSKIGGTNKEYVEQLQCLDSLTSKIGGTNKEYAEQSSGDVHEMNIDLSYRSFGRVGSMELIGLENLGNTCFMNSSIQCLAHTSKLVYYFLGDFDKDIYWTNPLGLNGDLALAFGELLRRLWTTDRNQLHHTTLRQRLPVLLLSSMALISMIHRSFLLSYWMVSTKILIRSSANRMKLRMQVAALTKKWQMNIGATI